MKTRQSILIAAALLIASACSCQKLDTIELDSSNTINGLKCYVYYNLDDWTTKVELDALSGTYNADKGAISYTFPDDADKYNTQTLSRCRLEVSIPSTASVIEVDALGDKIADSIGGLRNLCNKTVYFKVIAANGDERSYQATFKLK